VTCRSGGADCERRLSLPLSPRRPSFRFSSPLIEPDVRISRIRLSDGFHIKACARDERMHRSAPAWPSRRAPVGASGSFRGLLGSRQSPSPRLVRARPEPGPLPSTGVTQLPRYYGPLRRLPRPSPRRDRYRVAPAARQASRVASHRVRTCYAHYPGESSDLSRVGVSDRPRRPSSNERRLGARIQPFGACSGFTRVVARTLADPPKADLCPRGFDGSVALAVSRVATKVYRHLLGPDSHRLR